MKRPLNRESSFTSADSLPVKLMRNANAAALRPVHVQWIPTNRCNLRCTFCSCEDRNRDLEMDLAKAKGVIGNLAGLGCEAVTITGGGEPLMYPGLGEMIEEFTAFGIRVGLVTNGLLLHQASKQLLSMLTWCRISNSDEREWTPGYAATLERAATVDVDWAFSHVVSPRPNYEGIRRIVQFANEHDFTHVRLVSDILDAGNVDLEPVRKSLVGIDERVVYQDRSQPVPWKNDCWIGYVKPVIGPDWAIYPCCGVQYAIEPMARDLPPSMAMGSALDLAALYDSPRPWRFPCVRCYYTFYNQALSAMVSTVQHREFI